MKVEGPGRAGATAPGKVGGKIGGGGGDFSRMVDSVETPVTAAVSGPQALNSVDALLGLQEVDDATERRGRAKKRATILLDQLDGIRDCLLMGEMPPHQITALRDRIAREKISVDDPKLTELLEEVELRAEVELAKLEMAQRGE